MKSESQIPEYYGPTELISQWIKRIITDSNGFLVWEEREGVIFHTTREEGIANFVIRCLANIRCEGSDKVLQDIIDHRDAVNEDTLPPKVISYNFMRETLVKLDKSEITFSRMVELINQEINKQ
jgi:hypothetical protein